MNDREPIKLIKRPQTEREYFAGFSGEDAWPGGLTSTEVLEKMCQWAQSHVGLNQIYSTGWVDTEFLLGDNSPKGEN